MDRWRGRVAFVAAVLAGVAGIVLVGAPSRTGGPGRPERPWERRDTDSGTGTAASTPGYLLDPVMLTAWCRAQQPGDIAVFIADAWRCARIDGGFVRHDDLDDAPCRSRFGDRTVRPGPAGEIPVRSSPDGLRCLT